MKRKEKQKARAKDIYIAYHTNASIFVLVLKSAILRLFSIRERLQPFMAVAKFFSPEFVVKSTVKGFEHEGQDTFPKVAEYSSKQALQKT